MQFGLYLKKKGVITADQLVAALEEQHGKLVSIGQLAIEEGILTARDVFVILRCQRDLPHEYFGGVAVDMGILRRMDLLRLLALQWERRPPLADVLVRQEVLSQARVDEERAAYHRDMERCDEVISRCIPRPPHRTTAPTTATRNAAETLAVLI